MPFLFWDPTFFLIIPALIIAGIAQAKVISAFNKYSKVPTRRGVSGEHAARSILESAGVSGISFEHAGGRLSDHYDPRSRTIRLSEDPETKTSIAAVAIAAHECGHAIQHAKKYTPLRIRSAIAPVVSLVSNLAFPLLLVGILVGIPDLAYGAAIAFGAVFLFQLITLPVEFNASRRALFALGEGRILYGDELISAKKVLSAAAMTYVAATLTAFFTVFAPYPNSKAAKLKLHPVCN